MAVPDSQMRGVLHGRFCLFSYSGTPLNVGLAQQACAWLTPVQCYNKIPWDAMKLNKAAFTVPDSYSLLSMSPVGCQLSALKKAEDRDEIILRLFNPSDSVSCDAAVSFSQSVMHCRETGMDEIPAGEQSDAKGINGEFRPGQSRTFSLKLA